MARLAGRIHCATLFTVIMYGFFVIQIGFVVFVIILDIYRHLIRIVIRIRFKERKCTCRYQLLRSRSDCFEIILRCRSRITRSSSDRYNLVKVQHVYLSLVFIHFSVSDDKKARRPLKITYDPLKAIKKIRPQRMDDFFG